MTGSIRPWIPAAVVALIVAGLLGAAAYFGLRQWSTAVVPSPSPSVDIHSPEAVMAAVRRYYDVGAEARRTGNGGLIDSVTTGPDSLASVNFKRFIAEEAAKNRRSVIVDNRFSDWRVQLDQASATVKYIFWLRGHDTDASTGQSVEADMTIPKEDYTISLELRDGRWLVRERQFLGRHAS